MTATQTSAQLSTTPSSTAPSSTNDDLALAIRTAIRNHSRWKLRLATALRQGVSEFSAERTRCDSCCEFGRWLYGPTLDATTRRSVPYQVIKRLHREFHETAGEIMEGALSGNKADAQRKLTEVFEPQSEKLRRGLTKWLNEVKADRLTMAAALQRPAAPPRQLAFA